LKKILLITTANLTTNPRLLKELFILSYSYKLIVVVFRLGNWSDQIEQTHLVSLKNVDISYISARRSTSWFIATLIQKFSSIGIKLFPQSNRLISYLLDKRSLQIWWNLKRNKWNVDFVIAHNLGALYPSYKYSRKNNIPFAFDVEDYHPGEGVQYEGQTKVSILRKKLMQRVLPAASYVSFASPLIMDEVLKWCPKIKNRTLINNSFFSAEFTAPEQRVIESKNQPIKLVWFSQNIAQGRGLELIIAALQEIERNNFELHLIGNLYRRFYSEWIEPNSGFIRLHKPMSQNNLYKKLYDFDIGLAIELNNADYNRQICLTNKIFAYAQAGLYILATDTPAQKKFLEEYPWAGSLSGQSILELKKSLVFIKENIEEVRSKVKYRFNKAHCVAYENESSRIKNLIKLLVNE
jgi:hypothetical protein